MACFRKLAPYFSFLLIRIIEELYWKARMSLLRTKWSNYYSCYILRIKWAFSQMKFIQIEFAFKLHIDFLKKSNVPIFLQGSQRLHKFSFFNFSHYYEC